MNRMLSIGRRVLIVIGLIVLLLMVMDFNNRMAELARLREQEERELEQLAALTQTYGYLEDQIAYATSEAAVEQWAREEGRWGLPGDHAIIPLPEDGYIQATEVAPTPTLPPISNWRVWLEWFFFDAP